MVGTIPSAVLFHFTQVHLSRSITIPWRYAKVEYSHFGAKLGYIGDKCQKVL